MPLMQTIVTILSMLLAVCDQRPTSGGQRRAVLVGINDYSAAKPHQRELPDLSGAVRDVGEMKDLLMERHSFAERDILTITDKRATRRAILDALNHHLLQDAGKGDVLFFYFAGHGSQIRNSESDEPDLLDESLVPADSSADVRDIRDKELRPLFNRMLDRGARVTVLLDNCHSGSGARSLPVRGVAADLRDIADAEDYGPRPEDRGALVLAATQDTDIAAEVPDEQKNMHGAFTWAWLRSMREAKPDESAAETFARASARLRAERPVQRPVIAGLSTVTAIPFLGTRSNSSTRTSIAVEQTQRDGTVRLNGGRVHGLTVGTVLRDASDPTRTLTVTALHGLGRSEARGDAAATFTGGALMNVENWVAPRLEEIDSPSDTKFAYQLALRRERNGAWAKDVLFGGETYSLHLRSKSAAADSTPRYVYVLVVDRHEQRFLLYGTSSVENRLPRLGGTSTEIALDVRFQVIPPYGIDTFYVLTSDEPLSNPRVLEWDSVRSPAPLWSIERRTYASIPPHR